MVICSINQSVLSSGEGLGGSEGPMPRGGGSICGDFEVLQIGGMGALWVLVSCWGFTVGAIVGGWGLGGLGFDRVIITWIVPFDWGLLSGDGGLVGFWISLGPLPYLHGFSCGGALTCGYYLLALFPCTLFGGVAFWAFHWGCFLAVGCGAPWTVPIFF